ncbi:MAG: hypothetical protein H6510_14850 [Acidobacteria bacterium]|nr:hypothetical protein [Acidobacteriota bacterium]MCB9399091.1 hypothetical protein [Acidobacteriota bacterium]
MSNPNVWKQESFHEENPAGLRELKIEEVESATGGSHYFICINTLPCSLLCSYRACVTASSLCGCPSLPLNCGQGGGNSY